ncbi:AAA family ATPase [Paenibacillus sp. FSL M7-0896]|uniref:AAA family ATPase n=1 Tax=Paenibacillus sp. FSL M7-0896 TaxID=2921610 RepID=UPI0030D72905
MSRIVLKKIQINNKTVIEFNEKQNYIIGANATGKTTLFNLIQYILGLKSNSSRLANVRFIESPQLECRFGNKFVKISRKMDSSTIIFEGDIQKKARAMSVELNEIYTELLDIKFISQFNERASLDILSYSFFSGLDFKGSSLERRDTYNKIIGFNSEYLNQIERDIKTIEEEVTLESQGLKFVEQYKKEVEESIGHFVDIPNLNKINDVLKYEYLKIKERSIKNYDLLQNSNSVYKQEKRISEEYINEKMIDLESFFYETLKRFDLSNKNLHNISFKEILKQKNFNFLSFGERNIIHLVLRLTFCRSLHNSEFNNGVGLLVTDEVLSMHEYHSSSEINNKISDIVNEGELQFISFGQTNNFIPRELIVFEMPYRQGGGIFEG